jgi:hypothetical protein
MDGVLMGLSTQQAGNLGIASFVDAGVNVAVPATGSFYVLWVDSLPGPQNGKFWRVHAVLAQMFCPNNQSGLGGIFVCAPGTPLPTAVDEEGETMVLPGMVRVDELKFAAGGTSNVDNQLFQKTIHLQIGAVVMTGYLEPNPPSRTIIVPPQHFLRFQAIFAGAPPAPNEGNWYTLLNILYEQEATCP